MNFPPRLGFSLHGPVSNFIKIRKKIPEKKFDVENRLLWDNFNT